MPYTFWYSGILIGESDLEEQSINPRQHAGVFRPTAFGLEIFPRLTGILTAGHALKAHLDANGLCPETMEKSAIQEWFDTTPAGQKVVDIGRTLSQVELRAPDGDTLPFASIAFTDWLELRTLMRELNLESELPRDDLPPGAPRYVVSATFCDQTPRATDLAFGEMSLGRDN